MVHKLIEVTINFTDDKQIVINERDASFTIALKNAIETIQHCIEHENKEIATILFRNNDYMDRPDVVEARDNWNQMQDAN